MLIAATLVYTFGDLVAVIALGLSLVGLLLWLIVSFIADAWRAVRRRLTGKN